MKHYRLLAVLVAVLGLLTAACGDDSGGDDGGSTATPDTADLPTEVGEGEGALNIVAWAGYIEDGSTEADIDWVTAFEEETGCAVEVTTAGTSDEMVSLMTNSDDYDLVTASGDASLRLIAGETVQPVNLDLIPSYSTVDERLQGAPWYTIDGRRLRRALPVGGGRAHVQHRRLPRAPDVVGHHLRGAGLPRRSVQLGPHPAVRRPDLTSPPRRCTSRPPSPTSASRIRTP